MKRTDQISFLFILAALAVSAVAQSGGTFVIRKSVIGGGGGEKSSGGGFVVQGSIGQPVAGTQAQEIRKRQENQQDRIAQGVGSGQLTPRETARLENREANLNRTIRKDRATGGHLSAAERRQINRRQNRLSRDIAVQKRDARKK